MPTSFTVFSLGVQADMDMVEGNFTAENASALVGLTFGGPGNALFNQAQNFAPGVTGYTNGTATVYDQNAGIDTFTTDGGLDQVFDSEASFKATITYIDGTTAVITAVIFQDQLGNTYWAPETSNNSDQAAMEAGPIQSLTLNSVFRDRSRGLRADREEWDHVVCFARGTKIMTSDGEVFVENLVVGDGVQTMDNGVQTIRWIGNRVVEAKRNFAPVVFAPDSIGNSRTLKVSQQHRMLVSQWETEAMFGERQALSAAKHFVNHDTIYLAEGGNVQYFHILFDNHEIIFAEGTPTESFHPGEAGVSTLAEDQYEELMTLFPELRDDIDSYGASARMDLKAHEAKLVLGH